MLRLETFGRYRSQEYRDRIELGILNVQPEMSKLERWFHNRLSFWWHLSQCMQGSCPNRHSEDVKVDGHRIYMHNHAYVLLCILPCSRFWPTLRAGASSRCSGAANTR